MRGKLTIKKISDYPSTAKMPRARIISKHK